MLSFMLMVLSSLVAGYADVSAGSISTSVFVAYGWMIANCFTSACLTLLMKSTIKKVNFKDFDTVYYNSTLLLTSDMISIPLLLLCSLLMEREQAVIAYHRYLGDYAAQNSEEFHGLLVGIFISSCCTFFISYSTAWCIRINGATTYSMVGALNKLPIAIFGMIFFDAVISFTSVSSVLVGILPFFIIAFLAGTLYSYTKAFPPGSLPMYSKVQTKATQ